MKNLIVPFKALSTKERLLGNLGLVLLVLLAWEMSGNMYIPSPIDVAGAIPRLAIKNDIIGNFIKSISLCFTAMFYSTMISITVCYLSVLPIFRSAAELMRKFRFLPSAGLSLLFLKVAGGDQQGQMMTMMVFGVTTWMLDGMVAIALSITDDEVMYARTLRLSRWQSLREILIKGKAADLFLCAISMFAMAWLMLASVENIAKASGGIGVILAESNKYYKYEEVYAIQILILLTGISLDASLRWVRKFLMPYAQ